MISKSEEIIYNQKTHFIGTLGPLDYRDEILSALCDSVLCEVLVDLFFSSELSQVALFSVLKKHHFLELLKKR